MLIYIRLIIPGKPQQTLAFNIEPNDKIQSINDFVSRKIKNINVSRSLFAGKILDVTKTFQDYDIHKECTIQTMAKIVNNDNDNKNNNNLVVNEERFDQVSLSRQVTDETVRYGDVLIVNVMEARDLIKCDYWSGKSDPYCILSLNDKKLFRTRVISRSLKPKWNETFGFHLDSPEIGKSQLLTVLMWDHDYLTPDDFMGTVDINLADIPRYDAEFSDANNISYENWYKLDGVKSGEVRLLIRRAALTSPELRDILLRLEHKKRPWTNSMLKKYNVTLKHFLGKEPWVINDAEYLNASNTRSIAPNLHINPALCRLEHLLLQGTLRISNDRTLARVANILWSQGALYTQDLPSRYLWLCDVAIPSIELYHLLQEVSNGSLKSLVTSNNELLSSIPRRTSSFSSIASNNNSLISFNSNMNEDSKTSIDMNNDNNNNNREYRICAIATFKSCEDAILTLLRLQNRVLSLVTIDPEREDFVCVVPTQPRDISAGSANHVNVTLYDSQNSDHINPLHCGFASKPKQNISTGEFIHAFQDSINVGIISVAGPYPTTNTYEAKVEENGQSHVSSDWGYHLLVLHSNGILRAYTKLSDFDQKNCTFEMNIKSDETLILTCGPWSIELVDRAQKISYYLRAHNVLILSQWKTFLRLCKKSNLPSRMNNNSNSKIPNEMESYIRCKQCEIAQPVSNFYVLDQSNPLEKPPKCLKCVQMELIPFMQASKTGNDNELMEFRNLLEKFSIQDVKDLGTEEEFSSLLDACTRHFLAQSNNQLRVINCPKCNCPFEMQYHSWATKQPNLTKELGLDRQPLSPEAQAHFLSNRFRCPNEKCQSIFCRLCNKQPYHLGFTCDEYVEYLNSPKCRFCSMAVMDRNRWKDAPSEALKIVCSNEECIKIAKRSCTKMLECGHPCGGVVDEVEHLPCLHSDCVQLRLESEQKNESNVIIKADASDLCGICYTDELGNEPCYLLECGHIFHSNCLHERVKARWNGLRINFKYAHCPFCNSWMKGKNIEHFMQMPKRLYDQVLKKVDERLEIDEEEDDEYIDRVATDETSIYFNKPLEWALHAYAFYECSRCQLPYFGGRRNCEQNADDDQTNPDELICFDCSQNMGAKKCDIPGHSEFLLWKCRFCCSPAIWFCFGTTHFCDYCHSHWPPNRHPANEKCPPPGQDKCPLGLPIGSHQNGDSQDSEYCLGCAMCRQEAKKAISDERIKEEKEFIQKRIKRRKRLGLATDDLENDLSDSKNQGIGRHSNTLSVIRESLVVERLKSHEHAEGVLSNIPIQVLPNTDNIKYYEVVIYEPSKDITVGWALNSHPLHVIPGKDKLSFGINYDGTLFSNENNEKKDIISKCTKRCIIGCGIDKDGNGFFTKDGVRSSKVHAIGKKDWHAVVNFAGTASRIRFKFGLHFKYLPPGFQIPPNTIDNEPFPEEEKVKVVKKKVALNTNKKNNNNDNTPFRIVDDRHVHPLLLGEEAKFFCDGCQNMGSGKVYSCKLCKYDLHTFCAVVGPTDDNTWRCKKCTYINKKEQYLCEMCMDPKPIAGAVPKAPKLFRKNVNKQNPLFDPSTNWECPKCTKQNSDDNVLCDVCYEHRPRKNWNNHEENKEIMQNRREVLRDLMKDIRDGRYARAENDKVLVPFGPDPRGGGIEIRDVNYNELGIPQAPPLNKYDEPNDLLEAIRKRRGRIKLRLNNHNIENEELRDRIRKRIENHLKEKKKDLDKRS